MLISLLLIALVSKGIRYASKSDLYFPGTSLKELKEPNLHPLKWAETSSWYTAEVINDLANYLKEKDKNFFVFPDFFIMLYGVLYKPPPQPLLCFERGLMYPEIYDAKLDKWIVDDLKKNRVEIVVLNRAEEEEEEELNDFPQLKFYIFNNFSKAKEIGIFEIYELNESML